MGYIETVAHNKPPDQVFLADGAHYDNTAIIPLLRRKCSTIIAVDSEPERDSSFHQKCFRMAFEDLGVTFRPPHSSTACELAKAVKSRGSVISADALNDMEMRRQQILTELEHTSSPERWLQDFMQPRCVVNLSKLATKHVETNRSLFSSEAVFNLVANATSELKPVLSRLNGATHVMQPPGKPDLMYVYFKDAQSKDKAMKKMKDTPNAGMLLSPLGLSDSSVNYLEDAPMCSMTSLTRRVALAHVQQYLPELLGRKTNTHLMDLVSSLFKRCNLQPPTEARLDPVKGLVMTFSSLHAAQKVAAGLMATQSVPGCCPNFNKPSGEPVRVPVIMAILVTPAGLSPDKLEADLKEQAAAAQQRQKEDHNKGMKAQGEIKKVRLLQRRMARSQDPQEALELRSELIAMVENLSDDSFNAVQPRLEISASPAHSPKHSPKQAAEKVTNCHKCPKGKLEPPQNRDSMRDSFTTGAESEDPEPEDPKPPPRPNSAEAQLARRRERERELEQRAKSETKEIRAKIAKWRADEAAAQRAGQESQRKILLVELKQEHGKAIERSHQLSALQKQLNEAQKQSEAVRQEAQEITSLKMKLKQIEAKDAEASKLAEGMEKLREDMKTAAEAEDFATAGQLKLQLNELDLDLAGMQSESNSEQIMKDLAALEAKQASMSHSQEKMKEIKRKIKEMQTEHDQLDARFGERNLQGHGHLQEQINDAIANDNLEQAVELRLKSLVHKEAVGEIKRAASEIQTICGMALSQEGEAKFDELDSSDPDDKCGFLETAELRAFFNWVYSTAFFKSNQHAPMRVMADVEQLVQALDPDGDGLVSLDDVKEYLEGRSRKFARFANVDTGSWFDNEENRELLKSLDKNDDNFLQLEEVEQLLNEPTAPVKLDSGILPKLAGRPARSQAAPPVERRGLWNPAQWVQPAVFGDETAEFVHKLAQLMAMPAFKDVAVPSLERQVRIGRVIANFRLDEFATDGAARRHKKLVPVAKLEVFDDPEKFNFENDCGLYPAIVHCGLRWQHGLAMADSYRETQHWKVQYNDGVTHDGDLHIIKGEVSTLEAELIDQHGKTPRELWCCSSAHPEGTFPLNATINEAHSPALYRSYCSFKRRAMANILHAQAYQKVPPAIMLRRLHLGHGYNSREPQIVVRLVAGPGEPGQVSEYWLEFLPFHPEQGLLALVRALACQCLAGPVRRRLSAE